MIRSPLRYPGGKTYALKYILPNLPKCTEFRELMVGGGSITLNAINQGIAKRYVLNDLFTPLMNFWIDAGAIPETLAEQARKIRRQYPTADECKSLYFSFQQGHSNGFCSSVQFFFQNRCSFSGIMHAGSFSVQASEQNFTESSICRLEAVAPLLQNCMFHSQDYTKFLYGDEETLLLLDPPYPSAAKLYGEKGELHSFDHEKLAHELRICKCRWLLCYNNCPEIRALYSWAPYIVPYNIRHKMTASTGNNVKLGKELLISNYEIALCD